MPYWIKIVYFLFLCIYHLNCGLSISLSKSKECENDILRHCRASKDESDSVILGCLESSLVIIRSISENCQHFLWKYKNKFLDSEFFNEFTFNECSSEFKKFRGCSKHEKNSEVICLIKSKSKVTNHNCLKHLNEISALIFSDILVINKFISSCQNSINKLECGRLENEFNTFSTENYISRITSQGKTIQCLIKDLSTVDPVCRKEILRLGELQSEDFHLNPILYFSCRNERDTLCHNVEAGKSNIYRCLESQKHNRKMSIDCKSALNQNNRLEGYHYKIRRQFSDQCAGDISSHKCANPDTEFTDLSSVIKCLLQVKYENSTLISKLCRAELIGARSQMAENINMSPAVAKNCKIEISKFCKSQSNGNDSTLHCLMRHSMPALELGFSQPCLKSLKDFIQIVNPTENIVELDPLISQACVYELANQCSSKQYIQPSDRYECLLELIDEGYKPNTEKNGIKEDCQTHLLTLAQFIEQDYSLNHKLFKMCHGDAVKHCGAKVNIFKDKDNVVPRAVMHCLIRKWNSHYLKIDKSTILSHNCAVEIKSVMKHEAANLMLNFNIYTSCSTDVTLYCKTVPHKMDCLQLNYAKLKAPCKTSISNFLSLDAEEYSLKKLIARSCSPMVRKFCSAETKNHQVDYMECLLRHKFDKGMDERCRIAIEHYQIIGLDNYKIDHKFARFCSKEIQEFCQNLLPNSKNNRNIQDEEAEPESSVPRQVSKSEIVACLSKKLTISLLQNIHPFSAQCYEQFTFEFLQQTSSINVDPELRKVCDYDINGKCADITADKVLTCLHEHQDSLKEECVNFLVNRQQLNALDPRFDIGIQRYCKGMIEAYCTNIPGHKVFRCLHTNWRVKGFNLECKKRIERRLQRRLVDLRLNPEIIDNCKTEITSNCNVTELHTRISDMKFTNKYHIINCLRGLFVQHRKFLGAQCRRLVFDIVLDANSDIHLDPGLYDVCQPEIKTKCFESLMEDSVETNGRVQDCLKHSLLSNAIHNKKCAKEVHRLLREGMADIHVDQQLFAACRREIAQICHLERLGQGRKLSCLLWALESKDMTSFISTDCKYVLQERKQMWEFASQIEAPNSMGRVFRLVSESDSRYYILTLCLVFVLTILLIGIYCGRFTRHTKKINRNRR